MSHLIAIANLVNVDGALTARMALAATVTIVFAVFARLVRGVTLSGAVAGALVCFALFAAAGPAAFFALLAVFALTWISTRLGYSRKQKIGTAEKRDGRTASQVFANLGVAAIAALLYAAFHGQSVFLLVLFAALSEAAADTVSSEVGQARSDRARLITTFEEVPAGTDGGVTIAGTLAGLAAAGIVSSIALATTLPRSAIAVSIVSAALGMMTDSVLGAALERRNLLNNDAVNLLGTVIAALVAFLLG